MSSELFDRKNTDAVARFGKYLVLGCLAAILTVVVFMAFSFYAARRDLEAELNAAKVPSFEWLYQTQRNENALASELLETRCAERTELAVFRILQTADAQQLMDAYNKIYDKKLALITTINEGKNLINVADANDFLTSVKFDVSHLVDYLNPIKGVNAEDPTYVSFMNKVKSSINDYLDIFKDLKPAMDTISNNHNILLKDTAIDALETRLSRLHEQAKSEMAADQRNIVAKYTMWTESLLGSVPSALMNELNTSTKTDTLRDINCLALEQDYRLATGIDLRGHTGSSAPEPSPPEKGAKSGQTGDIKTGNASSVDSIKIPAEPGLLRGLGAQLFASPPIAQTLLVTLLMGALGAVTLHLLRLSKFGWWGTRDEPGWGEVLAGPFLGAIAAFSIFLIASTGLLLTTGNAAQSGATPLSAFFIGLLGFLSGLLYDEAFGQVKRVGGQYFSQTSGQTSQPSEADQDLARVLNDAKATIMASLVTAGHIGEQLAKLDGFTLFVPPDQTIPRELLEAVLRAKVGEKISGLDKWIDTHLVERRLSAGDLTNLAGTQTTLMLKDGSERKVESDSNKLKIAGAQIASPDISWQKGLIQILAADFS